MKQRKRPAKGPASEIPAHDWRTTDAQEIERRRQRARDERMRIVNLHPKHPVCSNFAVHAASGRTYHVEIRDPREGEYACECVDFRANGLGTCKHVEGVLLWLGRRERAALKQARQDGGSRDDVVPDRDHSGLRLVPRASGQVPRELARWFLPDGRRRDGDGDGDGHEDRKAALAAWRKLAGTRLPHLRISQEVDSWMEMLHRREDRDQLRREYELRVQSGEWPPHETLVPLFPYQREGMLHLAFTERALLADEMGLGKTIQAIAAAALLHRLGRARRVLVVTPASLKAEWEEQIRRFTPLAALTVFGHHLRRRQLYRELATLPEPPFFVIVNYEQAVPDLEDLNEHLRPDVVILDEAQRIKNWNTRVARRIKQLQSRYAFVLTGTPIENRIDELRSLVDFLDPAVLGSLFRFNRDFYDLDDKGRPAGYRNLDQLHRRVQHLILRRRKAEVERELPPRTDQNRFVKLTDRQRKAYAAHEQEVMRLVQASERRPLTEKEKERMQIELGMMRMTCDSNYILNPVPEERDCPKMAELARILEECVQDGAKVIVFSEWEKMLQLVRDHCREEGIDFAWHTGSVPQQKRRADIVRFKEDPACRVFLSTDAGATGLNLQAASTVVNCDLPWNPARLEQRIARAWRKHQTRPVTVINLIAEDTIEHRMLQTLALKKSLAESVLDLGGSVTSIPLRSGRQAMAERIRELTSRPAEPATPAAAAREAARRDPAGGFAQRVRQRLGSHLVACEERLGGAGERPTLLVVAEPAATARGPWLDNLLGEFFPPVHEDGRCPVNLEILDRTTYETIERLVAAGLLATRHTARRSLLDGEPVEQAPPPLSAAERARLAEHRGLAAHALRRAGVLGEAGFEAEAGASLREATSHLGRALAVARRRDPPDDESRWTQPPWDTLWGGAAAAVQGLLADPAADWRASRKTLEELLRSLPE